MSSHVVPAAAAAADDDDDDNNVHFPLPVCLCLGAV